MAEAKTGAESIHWRLQDLYSGREDPQLRQDMDWAAAAASEFARRYRVDFATLTAAELAQGSVMLKIDVEGQELAVLRGARRVLEQARDLVVAFEAHPEVARRTGIDPMACLSHLQSIRPFEIRIAERPDLRPDPQQPLFDQLRPARICNIICRSTRRDGGAGGTAPASARSSRRPDRPAPRSRRQRPSARAAAACPRR